MVCTTSVLRKGFRMEALLNSDSTTKAELYGRNGIDRWGRADSLYAAALAGAATKGNTGVEKVLG